MYDETNRLLTIAPILLLSSLGRENPLGTEISLEVRLVNLSGTPMMVNGRLQFIFDYKYREAYELKFELVDPTGTRIPPRRVIEDRLMPYPRVNDFVHLEPGGYCSRIVIVSDYFDLSKVGTCQVSAEYHNDHTGQEFGVMAWVGKVNSNVLQLKIKGI